MHDGANAGSRRPAAAPARADRSAPVWPETEEAAARRRPGRQSPAGLLLACRRDSPIPTVRDRSTTDVPSARTAGTSSAASPLAGARSIPAASTRTTRRLPSRATRVAAAGRISSVSRPLPPTRSNRGVISGRPDVADDDEMRLAPDLGLQPERRAEREPHEVHGHEPGVAALLNGRRQRHDPSRSHRRHRLSRNEQDGLAAARGP